MNWMVWAYTHSAAVRVKRLNAPTKLAIFQVNEVWENTNKVAIFIKQFL